MSAAGPATGGPDARFEEGLGGQLEPRRDDVDPPTGELSRLGTTVGRRFLQRLRAAQAGLSHGLPGTTTVENLRQLCDRHHRLSARRAFGEGCEERSVGPRGVKRAAR